MAHALRDLTAAGVTGREVADRLSQLVVSPVLTAHPTEVQRRSVLETERDITSLLRQRYGGSVNLTPDEEVAIDAKLHRLVLSLWQTAMLRISKLRVYDEINGVLEHFPRSFIATVPQLYISLEKQIAALMPQLQQSPSAVTSASNNGAASDSASSVDGAAVAPTPSTSPVAPAFASAHHPLTLPPFLQIGSWVGGDRDGNPFVNAQTLEYAVRKQAGLIFEHYFSELHQLHDELGMSLRLITPSAELLELAAASKTDNPNAEDEPYRR